MKNMFYSWRVSLWMLAALVLAACTTDPEVADEGSTEETNAFVLWEFDGKANSWHVLDNSRDKIVANRVADGLSGTVTLNDVDYDGDPTATISLDLAEGDEDPKDLSSEKGICIVYSSDFDIFVELSFGEEMDADLDFSGPMLYMPASATLENHCRRWDDLMQDEEKFSVKPEDLTEVKSIRLIFFSEESDFGASGEFKITKVTRYVEPVELYGTSGKFQVNESGNSLVAKSFYWDATTGNAGRILTGSKDSTAGRWYYYSGLHERDSSCFDFYGYDVHGIDTDFSPMYEKENAMVSAANFDEYELDSADYAIIGFDIVNEKQEGTDVSAWKGLCMSFYSDEEDFQVVLDVSNNGGETGIDNSWYADVKGRAYRHWAKIAWEAFKPNNPNGENFESAVKHASRIQFKFYEESKFILFKLGSYDQCGE